MDGYFPPFALPITHEYIKIDKLKSLRHYYLFFQNKPE